MCVTAKAPGSVGALLITYTILGAPYHNYSIMGPNLIRLWPRFRENPKPQTPKPLSILKPQCERGPTEGEPGDMTEAQLATSSSLHKSLKAVVCFTTRF